MKWIVGVIIAVSLFFSPVKGFSEDSKVIQEKSTAVHPLIPFTAEKHLVKCEDYLDYDKEYNQSLQCTAKKALPQLRTKNLKKPKCYIITNKAPDVHVGPVFSFVSSGLIFRERIVGFYEDQTETLYIVENTDAPMILRHELQHYFLDKVKKNGDGAHVHKVWSVCEPAHYTPSKEAIRKGSGKKMRNKYNVIIRQGTTSFYLTR